MKCIIALLLLLPFMAFAQLKQKPKPGPGTKTHTTLVSKPLDGFIINADIKGFPDGTKVVLLNGQTGAPEAETTILNNKFTFKGKMTVPDFRIILFNNQPPYITMFLDNSNVKITGNKDNIEKALITGSPSQADFDAFNRSLEPYKKAFDDGAPYDSVSSAKATQLTGEFAMQHPNSFISPLAIIRFNQVADDPAKTEILYNALAADVKASVMGMYLAKYLEDAKQNAVGTLLPDFTQTDTAGKPVTLSSFKGKYVLIDFWASWCGPCRQENPNVVAAYNKFRNRNFTILGVSLDKAKPAWEDAIRMDNLTWTHVSDLQGWSNAVALQFQIFNIPQNILIDPQGKIVGKNLRGGQLERKLTRVLR